MKPTKKQKPVYPKDFWKALAHKAEQNTDLPAVIEALNPSSPSEKPGEPSVSN